MKRCRTLLRLSLAGALLLLVSGTASGAREDFTLPYPLTPIFEEIYGAFTDDLDDDGTADLVLTQQGYGEIKVLMGNGDGTFGPPIPYSTGSGSIWVDTGDFDSDGNRDLAVSAWLSSGGVSVLLGNGDGTFAPEQRVVPYATWMVDVADFDGDDVEDLLLGWPVTVLFGIGDGTFGEEQGDFVQGEFVVAGDFDGNGRDDVAVAISTGSVAVYSGQADTTFTYVGEFDAGPWPRYLATGHLDEDGFLDLVAVHTPADVVTVLYGNGDGTFQSPQSHAVGRGPEYVSITDCNEDGRLDLLVSNYWSGEAGSLSVIEATGARQFAAAVPADDVRYGAYNLALADFDGDGREDVAKPCSWCGDVGILFMKADGSYESALGFEVAGKPASLAVADLNGDDRPDLVTAETIPDQVSVLLADGAGSFATATTYPVSTLPASVAVAELTGDAHLDVVVANRGSNTFALLQGQGDGTLAAPVYTLVGGLGAATPSSVAVGDLDSDDRRDLIVADEALARIVVFLGNGDGSFGHPIYQPVGQQPISVVVGRWNADAIDDVAVGNHESDSISILLGDGDGTFTPASTLATASGGPLQLAAGDVNGDSQPDLAVVNDDVCSGNDVCAKPAQVFLSNGDGSFAPPFYTLYFDGTSIAIVDVDGDGRPDLAGGDPVAVWFGNGDGTFDLDRHYAGYGAAVAGADFDRDRRTDLVAAGRPVSISLNVTGPSALTFDDDRVTLTWPSTIGALTYDVYRGPMADLVDLDADGLPDDGYGTCRTSLDDDARDTYFIDTDTPSPSGAGFFYLIAPVNADGPGGLGETSAGLPRMPSAPCP